ncbi:unnamed protein product, partial [Coregonus sp. 'balchen']
NQQARICLLYLPLLELLYQNLKQLSAQQHTSSPGLGLTGSRDYLRSTSSMDSRRTSMAIDKDHGPVAQNGHLVRREDSRGSLFMDLGTPNSSEVKDRGRVVDWSIQIKRRQCLSVCLSPVVSLSLDILLAYWNKVNPQDIINFLSLLE